LSPNDAAVAAIKLASSPFKGSPSTIVSYLTLTNSLDTSLVSSAFSTLSRYFSNIMKFPTEYRFRNIRTTNKVFEGKVAGCRGMLEFVNEVLECTWFVNSEGEYVTSVPVWLHDGRLEEVVESLNKLEKMAEEFEFV